MITFSSVIFAAASLRLRTAPSNPEGIRIVQKAGTEWLEYEDAGKGEESKSTLETSEADAKVRVEGSGEGEQVELQIATKRSKRGPQARNWYCS